MLRQGRGRLVLAGPCSCTSIAAATLGRRASRDPRGHPGRAGASGPLSIATDARRPSSVGARPEAGPRCPARGGPDGWSASSARSLRRRGSPPHAPMLALPRLPSADASLRPSPHAAHHTSHGDVRRRPSRKCGTVHHLSAKTKSPESARLQAADEHSPSAKARYSTLIISIAFDRVIESTSNMLSAKLKIYSGQDPMLTPGKGIRYPRNGVL